MLLVLLLLVLLELPTTLLLEGMFWIIGTVKEFDPAVDPTLEGSALLEFVMGAFELDEAPMKEEDDAVGDAPETDGTEADDDADGGGGVGLRMIGPEDCWDSDAGADGPEDEDVLNAWVELDSSMEDADADRAVGRGVGVAV